jgi:hypothetical protein
MESHRGLLIPILLIGLLFGSVSALAGRSTDKDAMWEPLVQTVKSCLLGKQLEQPRVGVAPGAQLIIQGNIVNLSDALGGRDKEWSLVEKSEKKPVSMQLKMNDREDAAYLVLGTQPDGQKGQRVHTVVFMKDSDGKWLMELWHVSNKP